MLPTLSKGFLGPDGSVLREGPPNPDDSRLRTTWLLSQEKYQTNNFWLVTRLSDLYSSTMEHLTISIRHKTNLISVLVFLFDFQMRPKIFHNRHFQFGQFFQFVIHHLGQNFQ